MKRILFLLFAVGLTANMTVMAGMSTSKAVSYTHLRHDHHTYGNSECRKPGYGRISPVRFADGCCPRQPV